MYRVYDCITEHHDLRLVVAAALICFLAAYTAFNLMSRAEQAAGRARAWWIGASAFAIGSGIWATHFIAMLGFDPPLAIRYDVPGTGLSIVTAIAIAAVGLAFSLRRSFGIPFLSGAIVGAGIVVMHYSGIEAWRLAGSIEFDYPYVVASLWIGSLGAGVAMTVAMRRNDLGHRLTAAVIMTLTICAMHFTGMASVVLTPNPGIAVDGSAVEPMALSIAVAAVTLLILALSLGGAIVDERLAAHAVGEAAYLKDEVEKRTAALAASEARLADAIATLPEAFALFDPDDRLVVCNEAYRNLYETNRRYAKPGVRFEDLARRFSESPEFAEESGGAEQWLSRRLAQRRRIDAAGSRIERRRPNGQYLDIHERRTREGGIVTLMVDVTESHDRMAELAEHEKLAALGQLAGGVAHEINNLLQPALVFPEMVRESLPEGETELREFLDTVTDSARKARDIVRSILLFSRKDAHSQEASLERVDLSQEVVEGLKLVRSLLPPGIVVELHDAEAAMPAEINKTELTQVLTNLIINAVQASGGNGVIDVWMRPAQPAAGEAKSLGLPADGTYWTIAVEDHGTGMDEATRSQIFDPFFTTKPQGVGTGLGLSVVLGIVRGWSGAIAVKSELSVGTTFTIFIPAVPTGARGTHAEQGDAAKGLAAA
jgi:NO-binding membrane sensor protein with MHYT domain/signal transduction histidine kinase